MLQYDNIFPLKLTSCLKRENSYLSGYVEFLGCQGTHVNSVYQALLCE